MYWGRGRGRDVCGRPTNNRWRDVRRRNARSRDAGTNRTNSTFRRERFCNDTTTTAVVTHTCHIADGISDDHSPIHVHVVDHGGIHASYRGVVEKVPPVPTTTHVAAAIIPIPVIDATVIADLVRPIPGVPGVVEPIPGPIARSPKQSGTRSKDPLTRNPVIAVRVPRPITWHPDVIRAWNERLFVIWERRRRGADGDRVVKLSLGRSRRRHGKAEAGEEGEAQREKLPKSRGRHSALTARNRYGQK